ncbi:MAG: hypothetical protein JRJ49_06040 [Deltaproteobacteria bacterium]|nr:hypothetical protein [Deltaproteobacteria bacterium]
MRDNTIFFSDSKGHALLSYIVKEAGKNKKRLGRTQMQKIPYVLKAIGIPIPYLFELYLYGPYCQDIVFAIDDMIADDVIEDESGNSKKYSQFIQGINADKLIKKYDDYIEPIKENIKKVVKIFSSWKPEKLELFTTLHYVYRKESATLKFLPTKNRIIGAFKKEKEEKFLDQEINKMLDILIEINFIKVKNKK